MNSPRFLRLLSTSLVFASILSLSACSDYDMSDTSDFGQKTLQKHYQNGEMNDYGYQSGVKAFAPDGTSPAMPAPAATTDKPATPAAAPASTTSP